MALHLASDETMNLLKEKQFKFFCGKEKQFEGYVADAFNEIAEEIGLPSVKSIVRQKNLRVMDCMAWIDIVAQHEDGSMSVIEVKSTNSKNPGTSTHEQCSAIGQLLLYRSLIKAHYGYNPRLFLIDTKIHLRTMLAFKEMDMPITLIEIQDDRVFIPYMAR